MGKTNSTKYKKWHFIILIKKKKAISSLLYKDCTASRNFSCAKRILSEMKSNKMVLAAAVVVLLVVLQVSLIQSQEVGMLICTTYT